MKTGARFVGLKCLLGLLLLAVPPLLQAGWIEYGVPVCIAPNDQNNPVTITDEAGGVIIAWTDYRAGIGMSNIYAQRMSADGDTLWQANGVALCDTANNKNLALMVPDGTGGAIFIWTDKRDLANGYDIYAQRIDGSGTRMWSGDGVAICDTLEDQMYPDIASDGAGGAIIVWQDQRGASIETYAQRIDGNGTVLWKRNGIIIDGTGQNPIDQKVVADNAGGAVITWERLGRIRAQRVNAQGDTLWQANGINVCTDVATQWTPKLVSDGSGGAIIAWRDNRTPGEFYIYAQRVDAGGDTLWTADGIPLCKVTNYQRFHSIVSDGSGGAIVAWEEDFDNQDIHAQRVDGSGNLLWTANGVDVCTASDRQTANRTVADGYGGAIIVWEDNRGAFTMSYGQRLDANGNPLWAVNGVSFDYRLISHHMATLLPGGSVGMYFVWEDWRPITESDIYISLANENGEIVPTLLQSYNADFRSGKIIVEWTLFSPISIESFTVFRKEATKQKTWEKIPVQIECWGVSYSFVDETCLSGSKYCYRVEVKKDNKQRKLFETDPLLVPEMPLVLYQNYPNPFKPSTTVRYYLPNESTVKLSVYDIAGGLISRLVHMETQPAGYHTVEWKGKDEKGRAVASGVYFYRLEAGSSTETRKLILLR